MNQIRMRDRHRIEYEYEVMNRELKSNNDYNLKRYLHEKKAIRDKMGLESSESIAEIITSQSLGTSQSHGVAKDHLKSGGASVLLQNFFGQKS